MKSPQVVVSPSGISPRSANIWSTPSDRYRSNCCLIPSFVFLITVKCVTGIVPAFLIIWHTSLLAPTFPPPAPYVQEIYSGLYFMRCSMVPGRFAIPFSVFGGKSSKESSIFSLIASDNFIDRPPRICISHTAVSRCCLQDPP